MNAGGNGYFASPAPTRTTLAPTIVDDGFGVNDYASDLNFNSNSNSNSNSYSLPLSSSPVIRVGKKFNQPGQGLLSPVRRSDVATYTFTPTAGNCKIRVYYLGMLQEPSNNAAYYAAVTAGFRKNAANQPACFGINCRYDYTSPIPNSNTVSRAGRTEFGTVDYTAPSTFVNNTANVNYGLNDMFSFYQGGTTLKQLPANTNINKSMTGWDSYVMDFSEFIGTPVTLTLFACTSNYSGNSQNHSYCYYQFQCLSDAATPLPTSSLSISTVENAPSIIPLGCLTVLPISTPVKITNTNPTLLGNITPSTPLQINNNTAFKWLSLPDAPANLNQNFTSNFASVSLDYNNGTSYVPSYTGVFNSGTTSLGDFTLNLPGSPTTHTLISNGYTNEYKFRIHYKTRNNSVEQIGYFTITVTIVNPTICNDEPIDNIGVTDPNHILTAYDATNYFICKTPTTYTFPGSVTLTLGASNCTTFPSGDPTTFLGYQWQRRVGGTTVWSNIGVPSLSQTNLTDAQNQVFYNTCSTQFRRVNVTAIPCGTNNGNTTATNESGKIFTIWNNAYLPISSNSTLTLSDFTNSSNTTTISNVSLGATNVVLCYGDSLHFNTTLNLGGAACTAPTLANATNTVSAQFIINAPTGNIPLISIPNQALSGNSAIIPISFDYQALNGLGGLNFSGASASLQLPITLVLTTTINGCTSTSTTTFLNIQIFPRAVGGAILAPACPLLVSNNPAVFTMGYDPNGSSTNPAAYDWSYCTSYTTTSPGNYTCTGSWTTIAGQGGVNLPLWTGAALGLTRPYILKRTAKSGNNCGGAEDSNSIEITDPQPLTVPSFVLPPTLCKTTSGATTFAMPVGTPVVNGSWYEYTSIPSLGVAITQLNLATLTAGVHHYLFVPATPDQNSGVCYDFVKWDVTVYDTVTPTFTFPTTYCDTDPAFDLPTVSNNGITGTWSMMLGGTQTPVTQWSPALYTGNSSSIVLTFTGTNGSGQTSSNPCNGTAALTIVLNHTITFSGLPTALCQGAAPYTLPTQSNIAGGHWTLAGTTVTQVATTTLGNYVYTYSGSTSCAAYTYTVSIMPPVTPATLTGINTVYPGSSTTITPSISGGSWSAADTNVATVNASGVATGVSIGQTTISYTLPGTATCPAVSTSFTLTVVGCNTSTTWSGGSWSNGTPNTPAYLNTTVIFNGAFTSTEDLYACSVHVNNGTVRFSHIGLSTTTTANTLTVTNEVVVATGATLEFDDDASLVQINDIANSGSIQYTRRTPFISNYDYVYWSSPVDGQNLSVFSPNTLPDKFYTFSPVINNWVYANPTSTAMATGVGYIIRGPQTFSLGNDQFPGVFTGPPHNGTLTTPVVSAAATDNLIGNPYPSGLDIDCFMADPANAMLNGTVYLWCHNIPIDLTGATQQGLPGNALYNYNVNSYGAYNRMGGVGTGVVTLNQNRLYSDRCLGKIAAGQSFFVEANGSGTATFKNSMRVGSQNQANSQFFKNAATATTNPAENSNCVTEQRHRLWLHLLNLTASPQQFKQTLVGYSPLATTSATLDRNYDGLTYLADPYDINFYSLSPASAALTIQGRYLGNSFDTNDVVPLGYTCKMSGVSSSNTIQLGLSEFDGLFANQEVFLRENMGGGIYQYYNLKAAPYTFSISSNVIDNTTRFAIVFKAPLTTQLNTFYCGKTGMALNSYVQCNPVAGANAYEWLVTPTTGSTSPTVIATTLTSLYLNNANFPAGFIRYNETYTIRVHAFVGGVWTAYGAPCTITTLNPTTQLTTCGGYTLTALSQSIGATAVNFVPGYHWELTNMTTGGVYEFNTTSASFSFSNILLSATAPPTGFVNYNTQYCIRVRPLNIQSIAGTAGIVDNLSYASTCCVTTPNPTTQLANCGGYTLTALTQTISISTLIASVPGYSWQVTNMTTAATCTFDTTQGSFAFNPNLTTPSGFVTNGTQYCIRVRPLNIDGSHSLSFPSSCCMVTTPGSAPFAGNTETPTATNKQVLDGFSVVAAPNPFSSGFQLQLTTPLTSKVQVQLYDLLGQQILNESYTPEELENHIFALDVAAGIYQAIIRQEDHTEVVKIIKK